MFHMRFEEAHQITITFDLMTSIS